MVPSGKHAGVGGVGGRRPEGLRRPVLFSALGHLALAVAGVVGAFRVQQGEVWGEDGPGGAATVSLVSAASVPLPAPSVATRNRVATEDRGLHYPEPPKPEPTPRTKAPTPPVEEKAVELPSRNARRVVSSTKPSEAAPKTTKPEPAPPTPPRQQQLARQRPPEVPASPGNEIPYGAGGPAQGPYGIFSADAGTGGFQIVGGGGDFGNRYGWYVTAMRNRISNNWLKSTVDPNIQAAPRVYVVFQILRDGQIVNIQLTSSSGVASLDRSAVRAIMDSNPMPALPTDYSGPNVAVEFWFDFRR